MSCAVNADVIGPKNSQYILFDFRPSYATRTVIQPYTATLSVPVNIGSFSNVATQTGTLTYDGIAWFLELGDILIPPAEYAGSVAHCPLLVGSPAIPTEDILFFSGMETGAEGNSIIKLDTSGVITYYTTMAGAGFPNAEEISIILGSYRYVA